MTRGYRFRKIVAVSSTIDTPVATKAQPSSRSRSSHSTAATARSAVTGTTPGTTPSFSRALKNVHARNPSTGVVAELAVGAKREEHAPMQREQQQGRDAAEERVGVQQVQERARPLAVRVDRHPPEHVRERDSPQESGDGAAPEDRPVPPGAPRRAGVLAPELERHPTEDQGGEDEEQREVEAAEQGGVPLGEGGERRAAGDEEPDLVAVPHRADRVHDHAPV